MSWREHAVCRTKPVEMFMPKRGRPVDHLRAICAACPVRQDCLDEELDGGRLNPGFRGGMSERERRLLRKQRRAERDIL